MDKRINAQTDKVRDLISHKNMSVWEKKRRAFFASNPKCKQCGGDFDHYSRTMICRNCQKINNKMTQRRCSREYRERNKEYVQEYQQNYYLRNREEITLRKKIKYHEKKRQNEA